MVKSERHRSFNTAKLEGKRVDHIYYTKELFFQFLILRWYEFFFLIYFIILNGFYITLFFLSIRPNYRRYEESQVEHFTHLLSSGSVPPIAIIIAGFNENYTLVNAIRSALNVKYSHLEVIAVDDGSTDETMEILKKEFQLIAAPPVAKIVLKTPPVNAFYRSVTYPNLLIIDKVHSGKGDSRNVALNACTAPYCLMTDSDAYLDPDICQRMMRRVLTEPTTIAAAGTLRIANGCEIKNGVVTKIRFPKLYLEGMQTLEYMRAFTYARAGWSMLGGTYLISGGFGLFKKDALIEVGGYRNIIGEDRDITLRLHELYRRTKRPYKMDNIPDATIWVESPFTLHHLSQQRRRWQRGMPYSLLYVKYMLFNPKYWPIGFIHMPFAIFGEFLAPVVEVMGYMYILFTAIIGILNLSFAWLFFLLAWGINILLTLGAVLVEQTTYRKYRVTRDVLKMLGFTFIELLGYRQMTAFWRLMGIIDYIRAKPFIWRKVRAHEGKKP